MILPKSLWYDQQRSAHIVTSFSTVIVVNITPKPNAYVFALPVRWGDMDALGHVNNATYFSYLEQARAAWLHEMGVEFVGQAQGPVVLTSSMTYRRPVVYPDTIEVRIHYDKVGRTSFDLGYSLWSEAQQALVADAHSRLVWVDYAKNTPVPVPDTLRSLFSES